MEKLKKKKKKTPIYTDTKISSENFVKTLLVNVTAVGRITLK